MQGVLKLLVQTSDGPNIRIRKCEYSHVFLLLAFACANIKKKNIRIREY